MEHVPNSKHLKYGYKKADIFTPTQGYMRNSEHCWNISIYNWTYYINPFTEHVPNSKILKYGFQGTYVHPDTGIYVRQWTFKILVYKTEHIILTPSRNMYQTVKIWNMAIKRPIFYPDTGIYAKQWTFEILVYKTEHIILTPSQNMHQIVYFWNMALKRHIFSPRHTDICETVNIWNIGI